MKNDPTSYDDTKFTGRLIYGVIALWFAFALWMGAEGRYQASPKSPPLALGLTLALPVLFFVLTYSRHGSFWRFCQSLDLRFVVAAHLWRIMAIDFVLCTVEGRLPAGFGLPAGIGDIITGIAAVSLAFGISQGKFGLRKKFVAWNVFGLFDLILAVSLGIMHSPGPAGILAGSGPTTLLMSELPRSLIPTFLVPLFMLLHLLALARRNEVRDADSLIRSV